MAAENQQGALLGNARFPATPAGYADLVGWLARLGRIARVAVEGTSSYGAGLADHCRRVEVAVFEVSRPSRRTRRPDDLPANAEGPLRNRGAGSRPAQRMATR